MRSTSHASEVRRNASSLARSPAPVQAAPASEAYPCADPGGGDGDSTVRALRRSRRWSPQILCPGRCSEDRALPRRPDDADAEADRFQARRASGLGIGWAWSAQVPGRSGPHLHRDLGQGGAELGLRARPARRGDCHLAALLAGLPNCGADRQGQEAEAGDHRRHRLGSRRPAGGDRARRHRRRGHLQQQHQRVRACGDDDPVAGAQLHPVLPVGRRGWLEHRRLRFPLLRSRSDAGRHGGRRTHRLGRAAAPQAVRREVALHRPASAPRERSRRSWASPIIRTSSRWFASATWSRSTRRCIRRPSTCSTTR